MIAYHSISSIYIMLQMAKHRTLNEDKVHTIDIGLKVTNFHILQAQKQNCTMTNCLRFTLGMGNKLQLSIAAVAYLPIHLINLSNSCVLGFSIIPIHRCYYLSEKETTKVRGQNIIHSFAIKPINSQAFNGPGYTLRKSVKKKICCNTSHIPY